VHPASSHHVDDVIAKVRWLRAWLASDAREIRKLPATFVWVASGAVALPATSPRRRRIADQGIHFAGKRCEVDALGAD
jgi:hypothetical protein